MFERLSVLASRGDAEAAREVCGGEGVEAARPRRLDRLVERSMVTARSVGEGTRFGMLETLREFARDRLTDRGEHEQIRDRHADWYALLADRHAADAERDWTLEMFTEGMASFEEVRTACAWAIERDSSPLRAFRLMRPLGCSPTLATRAR